MLGATPEAPKTVVRYAIVSFGATQWPDFVAQAEGLYARQGLTVETNLIDNAAIVAALLGGSLDVALTEGEALTLADDRGADLVAVAIGSDREPYHLMAAPAVKTIKDLKGKKIALGAQSGIYTIVTKAILRRNGLDPDKDVEILYGAAQNQRYAAVLGGAVQAGLFTPPADADLAAHGFNDLAFTPDYYPNLTLSVQAVRRSWAEQHPDVMRRFLRARADAVAWLNAPVNKAQAIVILMYASKASLPAATAAYDYYITRAHFWTGNGCIAEAGLDALLKILVEQKMLKNLTAADAPKLMDTAWCPR